MLGYDFLRIHRRIMPAPNFLVNLEDLLFAGVSAIAVFYITYLKNNGEIRLQTAIGLILGMLLYRVVIKDRFVIIGCAVWRIIARTLRKITGVILAPFVLIFKVVLKPARLIFWYSGKGIKNTGTKMKRKFKEMSFIVRKK